MVVVYYLPKSFIGMGGQYWKTFKRHILYLKVWWTWCVKYPDDDVTEKFTDVLGVKL